jgi:hypothetical protein
MDMNKNMNINLGMIIVMKKTQLGMDIHITEEVTLLVDCGDFD